MRTSKCDWVWMAMLRLMVWPLVAAAHGDWRIGQAQERLKAAGFNPGSIDSVLGPRTREALRRDQASQGFPTSGVLDETTRQALLAGDLTPKTSDATQDPSLQAPPGGDYKKLSSIA